MEEAQDTPQYSPETEAILEALREDKAEVLDAMRKLYNRVIALETRMLDRLSPSVVENPRASKPPQPNTPKPPNPRTNAPAQTGAITTFQITSVVVREYLNDDDTVTPVVDCYTSWKGSGKKVFGAYRVAGFYLNTDDDIQLFEMKSGLVLDDLQYYEGQRPLKRAQGKNYSYEYACRTPFTVYRKFVGIVEGKNRYEYSMELMT